MAYELIFGDIQKQQYAIEQQRSSVKSRILELGKPDPRTRYAPGKPLWWKDVRVGAPVKQRQIAQKKRIVELRSHLVDLTGHEKELKTHGEKIRGYQREGYTAKKTNGQYQFTKRVYIPGKRVREVSVMVHWVNSKTGKTGRFQGTASRVSDYERQLGVTGRVITKVTSIGGGTQYKTTKGYWTTKDKVLWEMPEQSMPEQPETKRVPFLFEILKIPPGKERIKAFRRQALDIQEFYRGKTFTPQEYFQEVSVLKHEASTKYSEFQTMIAGIDPSESYKHEGVVITGVTLKAKLEEEYGGQFREQEQQIHKAWQQAKTGVVEWHPETVITKKKGAYTIAFPFAGAELYTTYKKKLESDPLGAAILGWGWGGLGNIDIAYYKLTGQPEKALEKQISQLAGYSVAKKTLAAGDILGFSGHYWKGYLASPATQIGFAAVGGYAVTKAVPYLAGLTVAKVGIIGGIAVKGVAIGAGGLLVGTEAIKITDLWRSGKKGEALGRGWLLGSQIAAAYTGYKLAGGRAGMMRMEAAGYQKGLATPIRPVVGKYMPMFAKDIYKNLGGQLQQYKGRFADIRAMKYYDPVTYKYGARMDVNVLESGEIVGGKRFRFPSFWKKLPDTKGFKLGDRGDIYLYGRKGMVSGREGISTLEQTMYKRPDPFMAYEPSGIWGAYETSWSFYRHSLIGEVPTRIPVTTRVPFKITDTDTGQLILKGSIFGRTGMARVRTPLLETGKVPSEFTVSKHPYWVSYKRTPFKFPKVKTDSMDSYLFPEEPTPAGLVTTMKGVTPTRFRLIHDVTDYRFLSYLESLEPSYKPITSQIAPSHISRFSKIVISPTHTPGKVADLFTGISGTIFDRFTLSALTPKIDIKVGGKLGFDYLQERRFITDTLFKFYGKKPITKQITDLNLATYQQSLQEQLQMQRQIQLTKLISPPILTTTFFKTKPPYEPPIPTYSPDKYYVSLPPEQVSPYVFPSLFNIFFPKTSLYGRSRKYGDYDLFGKERKFRKRDMYDPLKDLGLALVKFGKVKKKQRKRRKRGK